jgi:bifunctional non-homologous end joining protein LigD
MEALPAPMLPMEGPVPSGPGWSHEMKWDGIRVMCGTRGVDLRIQTKSGKDATDRLPELADITGVLADAVLDGELVAFTGGRPDWGATMSRRLARPAGARALAEESPVHVLVFDLLRLGGADLVRRPYEERRGLLETLRLPGHWIVPPVFANGPATVAASLEHGLEGTVSKRLGSRYEPGRRSRNWVKHRHQAVIDATVIGWVRRESGGVSLYLAERAPGGWRYVGRCRAPRNLADVLAAFAADAPPVAVPGAPRGVHWVRPVIQVEVSAASREPDGRLRLPRFERVRLDDMEP